MRLSSSKKILYLFLLLFTSFLSCKTHRAVLRQNQSIRQAQDLQRARQFGAASSLLAGIIPKGKLSEQFLFLTERGTAFHDAGQYKESMNDFRQAEGMFDKLDVISFHEIAIAPIIGSESIRYRGERYERVLVRIYAALDAAALGDMEEALVDCRAGWQYFKAKKKRWEHAPLLTFLQGSLYEATGDYQNAEIDYRSLQSQGYGNLIVPILKSFHRSGDTIIYKKTNQSDSSPIPPLKKAHILPGHLIVVYSGGWIPEKIEKDIVLPTGDRIAFPIYEDGNNPPVAPFITLEQQNTHWKISHQSTLLLNISDWARKTLKNHIGEIVVKSGMKVIARHSIKEAISKKSKTAGAILEGLFFMLEHADLRGWSSLPAGFFAARFDLPPGQYTLTLPAPSGELTQDVAIKSGKFKLLSLRSW